MPLFNRRRSSSSSGVDVTFTESVVDTTDASAFTYSAVALGDADTDRLIVVCTGGTGTTVGNRNVSTLTIGGVSASLIVTLDHQASSIYVSEMWSAVVPTGTTGDIVVTWNNTMTMNGIGVYRVMGADTTPHATATDASDASGLTVDINVEAGGAIIGYSSVDNTGTFVWSGLTEDFDEAVETTLWFHSGAHDEFEDAVTPQTITVTDIGSSREGLIAVSFSPA